MHEMAQQVTTADELLQLPRGYGKVYELVRGELRTVSAAGHWHGRVAMRMALSLAAHVEANDLGVVYAAETGFILETDPDTVLAPDVSFVTKARATEQLEQRGFFPGPPDLAVEVLSPSDTTAKAEAKAVHWLELGTRLVVLVDRPRQTVSVVRSRDDVRLLREDDTLDGGDVVPGWSVRVGDLF